MASVMVQRGGGGFGGSGGAQEESGQGRGGAEEVSEETEVLLLSSTRRWLEWVHRRIILSPLSFCGSHRFALSLFEVVKALGRVRGGGLECGGVLEGGWRV